MREFLSQLFRRSEVKLIGFGLAAVTAVYFGFIGLSVASAGALIKRFGYYFMLATFTVWGIALWRLWCQRPSGRNLSMREWWVVSVVIGLFSLLAFNSEPFRSKVLYDEFVLQSTAYNMHYFRDAAAMVRGYDVLGAFISTDSYLDKRPNFFPFLISLIHDFTGYRTQNAYWLNTFLLPIALSLAYYLGRRLNGMRGGLLAVLLLGSLPLLGQNATGSGMELLNVVMILAVISLSAAYLERSTEDRLSALVLGAILLAQTRYESAIYVAPVALVILLGWWRTGRVILSWAAIVAPLFLVPSALQNRVISNTRWMWELKENQESRFSTEYLMANLHGARDFLFNTSAQLANSWPLAVLGLPALAYLSWCLLRSVRVLARLHANHAALLLISLGVLTNTALIMFYYWSNLADPIASRLSLPFYVLLTFAIVAAATRWDSCVPATVGLVGVMTIFAMGVTISHQAQHLYSHLGIDEIEWEKRYVASLPPGDRLIITNKSTMPWLFKKIPSILIGRTNLVGDRLQYQLERHTFRDILVFQSLRPTTREGDHQLVPEDRVPSGFELEMLTEKRFGTKIDRVSRLMAINLPAGDSKPALATP